MKHSTVAAATVSLAGFGAVASIARNCTENTSGYIFAVLITTLAISLAFIGSDDRNNPDDDTTK